MVKNIFILRIQLLRELHDFLGIPHSNQNNETLTYSTPINLNRSRKTHGPRFTKETEDNETIRFSLSTLETSMTFDKLIFNDVSVN